MGVPPVQDISYRFSAAAAVTRTLKSATRCIKTTYDHLKPNPSQLPCYPEARKYVVTQTNPGESSKRPKIHRPTLRRGQSRLPLQRPQNRHRCSSPGHPRRRSGTTRRSRRRIPGALFHCHTRAPPLVDTLVNCEWLLRRLSRGEAEL